MVYYWKSGYISLLLRNAKVKRIKLAMEKPFSENSLFKVREVLLNIATRQWRRGR